MTSKLLGGIQSRFDNVFTSKFDTVWRDQNNYIHIVLYRNEFLSDEDKCNTNDLLVHNKRNNSNLWCTYLPYELKKGPLLKVML